MFYQPSSASSSTNYSTQSAEEQYLVILLKPEELPRVLPKSDPFFQQTECPDSLIIPIKLLIENEDKITQLTDLDSRGVYLQNLIKFHNRALDLIELQDMGQYGQGIFAKTDIVNCDQVLWIYSGEYGYIEKFAKKPSEEQIYLLQLWEGSHCAVDPLRVAAKPKYMQYLPNNILDTGCATANCGFRGGFNRVKVGNNTYSVPIVWLKLEAPVEAKKLIGWDYGAHGFEHWLTVREGFATFTPKGVVISTRCCISFGSTKEETKLKESVVIADPMLMEILLKTNAAKINDTIYVIPACFKSLLGTPDGSIKRSARIPYLYAFKELNKVQLKQIQPDHDGDSHKLYISMQLTPTKIFTVAKSLQQQVKEAKDFLSFMLGSDINDVIKTIDGLQDSEKTVRFMFSIDDIAQATPCKIKGFLESLTTIMPQDQLQTTFHAQHTVYSAPSKVNTLVDAVTVITAYCNNQIKGQQQTLLLDALTQKNFSLMLRRACNCGFTGLVSILLWHKDILKIQINETSTNGNTPYDWVISAAIPESSKEEIGVLLLQHGAKVKSPKPTAAPTTPCPTP